AKDRRRGRGVVPGMVRRQHGLALESPVDEDARSRLLPAEGPEQALVTIWHRLPRPRPQVPSSLDLPLGPFEVSRVERDARALDQGLELRWILRQGPLIDLASFVELIFVERVLTEHSERSTIVRADRQSLSQVLL